MDGWLLMAYRYVDFILYFICFCFLATVFSWSDGDSGDILFYGHGLFVSLAVYGGLAWLLV